MVSVAQSLASVREVIGKDIALIAVTKGQPFEKIAEALSCGHQLFGNNYVQEGASLLARFPAAKWHFIGHIQGRKAKELCDYSMVQSLERIEIAKRLDARLKTLERKIDVLVQVNIGREPQKSGVMPERVPSFLDLLSDCSQLRIKGFMALPPALEPVERRAPFFAELRSLFEKHQIGYGLEILSMGTSEDYGIAAREGTTMVRLGTAIFGARV